MRDDMVFAATNMATAEPTSASTATFASRTTRRASAAVYILLTLIISAVVYAPGAGMALKAYADDTPATIGVIRVDGKDTNYSSYKALREELAKQKGKQVTVEMRRDWNARSSVSTTTPKEAQPDARLIIPAGAKVTLNMNGCIIDRGLAGYDASSGVPSGEVILVETGATLVVNGARAQDYSGWAPGTIPTESHTVDVYTSANGTTSKEFSGGLISGGNSKDGPGGIRMQSGSTLHLNDVTIAGCRNNASANEQRCGGGVNMEGGETALK